MHTVSAIFSLLVALTPIYASAADSLMMGSVCGSNITTKLGWGNPLPYWQHDQKPDGIEFCVSRYDSGARIVGMAAFKTYDANGGCDERNGNAGAITRLEVRFDDGQIITIGKSNRECQAGSFGLDDDMVFNSCKTNRAGAQPDGQGKMEFSFHKVSTPNNNEYHWLKDEYNPGAEEQNYNVGGGNLIGLVGYQSPDALLTVVPVFSPAEIDHIGRSNVYYNTNNLENIKKVPFLVGGHAYINNDTATRSFEFAVTDTRTTTYTTRWTHSAKGGMTYTIKLEEGWKIPLIHITKFSGEIAGTWEVGTESGADDTTTKTRTITGTLKGDVPPGSIVICDCTGLTATGEFQVTSDITIYYKDGSKWTYTKIDTISGEDMAAPQSASNCQRRDIDQSDYSRNDVTIYQSGDGQPGTLPSDASNSQLLAWASYTNPLADPSAWDRLIKYDTNKLSILVANVLNGPDYVVEKNWADVIKRSAGTGKTVLGYVRTGYLGVSQQKFKTRLGSSDLADWISQIEQDVDKWYELYGNDMGGIFFDEGWPECGSNNIYSDVYAYINAYTKKKHPGAYTVLNPGSPMAQCFEDTMDTLLTFEASYDTYINKFVPNSWTPKDDRKIWHIIYNVPEPKIAEVANLSKQRHAGFIEITNEDATPNPYDQVPRPTFMKALFDQIPGGLLHPADGQDIGGNYFQPGSPNDVQVAATDYTSVTLIWSPVSGAGGYTVFKDDVLVVQLPSTVTRARIGMMNPGSSAKFEVRTIVSAGVQGSPITVTASTQNLPADGAISNLKVTKNGDGSATYNADVLVPYAFVRIFIAGPHLPNNASAGWPLLLGARYPVQYGLVNYMIEGNDFYSGFYKYGGSYVEGSLSPADWLWTPSGAASLTQSGYTYTWNVPTGGTDAVLDQFIVQGQGYAPIQNVSSGAIRQTPCANNQQFCYKDKFE